MARNQSSIAKRRRSSRNKALLLLEMEIIFFPHTSKVVPDQLWAELFVGTILLRDPEVSPSDTSHCALFPQLLPSIIQKIEFYSFEIPHPDTTVPLGFHYAQISAAFNALSTFRTNFFLRLPVCCWIKLYFVMLFIFFCWWITYISYVGIKKALKDVWKM
jgi:hypothetical protein